MPQSDVDERQAGFPVIGVIAMQRVEWNPFGEFDIDTVQGLAHVSVRGRPFDEFPPPGQGNHLHLLAIATKQPGSGNCRRFLADCMAQYEAVTVYSVISTRLREMLVRRGFVPCVRYIGGGMEDAMTWERTDGERA